MNQVPHKFEKTASLEPGIYFGLPEDRYHSDVALGSGSIRSLANHPIYYWKDSWMNPLREPENDTEALLFGRALHKIVLEGVEAFHGAFAPWPVKADFPLAFDTMTQMKARLKELGQKVSGAKPDLVARLKEADPEALFWEDVENGFETRCRKEGKTPLKRKMYEAAIAAASFIAEDQRVAPAFRGGVSEVTVVGDINGVRCKARFDKLRFGREGDRTVAVISDLKSFTNISEIPPERAVASAIANSKLHIQAAEYLELAAMVPGFIADGRVSGDVDAEFLKQLGRLSPGDWRWFWCFFEKGAPVNMLRSPSQDIIDLGRSEMLRALDAFREHMDAFGTAWRFVDPIPDTTITLADLPKWVGY